MDYSQISKKGVELLHTIIENDSKNLPNSPGIIEDLLDKFNILSSATEKYFSFNERQNHVYQEFLDKTTLVIQQLHKGNERLLNLIRENENELQGNQTLKDKAQKELKKIRDDIAEIQQEIEKLKPKIEFQWWWVFCWWCGLIAAAVQNDINARLADIERITLRANVLQSILVSDNLGEVSKAIGELEKQLLADQVEYDKVSAQQSELEKKAKLFAAKTASTGHLNMEINFIMNALQRLHDGKDRIYLLKARLDSTMEFCDGDHAHDERPVSTILANWGETLNKELNPSGESVQAVRLAIHGKEFGHFRKLSESMWELMGTEKFKLYKDTPIAKILSAGPFQETHRDRWSIYLQDNTHYISVDIWKNILTATSKATKEQRTVEIIDGARTEKVQFYGQDNLSLEQVLALCKENNWRLASEFELSLAWIYQGLHVDAWGRLRNRLFAVPVQQDTENNSKKGLNIQPEGSGKHGNQGFFYVENKILTFRKLTPGKDTSGMQKEGVIWGDVYITG